MGDWDGDQGQVFFANAGIDADRPESNDADHLKPHEATMRFREFIRNFHDGSTNFVYRDLLKSRFHSRRYHLNVDLKCVAIAAPAALPPCSPPRCAPAADAGARDTHFSPRFRAYR